MRQPSNDMDKENVADRSFIRDADSRLAGTEKEDLLFGELATGYA